MAPELRNKAALPGVRFLPLAPPHRDIINMQSLSLSHLHHQYADQGLAGWEDTTQHNTTRQRLFIYIRQAGPGWARNDLQRLL